MSDYPVFARNPWIPEIQESLVVKWTPTSRSG